MNNEKNQGIKNCQDKKEKLPKITKVPTINKLKRGIIFYRKIFEFLLFKKRKKNRNCKKLTKNWN